MGTLENAHALIIGVGNDLPITVRDATALYNLLAEPELGGYSKENITKLTEETATRDGILNAFDALIEKTDEDSSVLLFYSGHGGTYTTNDLLEIANKPTVPEEENLDYFFLQPSNFDVNDFNNTWVKAEELRDKLKAIKSRRLVLLLDCCHAAGMTQNLNFSSGYSAQKELQHADGLAQNIDDGKGMSIISSCREDQKSWILEGDYNSLFTKCLLEVLRGEHRKHLEEPFIRISETIQYIFRKVPERKPVQKPYANIQIYDDFILSKVPEARLRTETFIQDSEEVLQHKSGESKPLVTVYRETDTSNSAILFVHGFSGEASESFGNLPELLMNDEELNGWDMFPLGYSGAVKPNMGKDIWASVDDITTIADYLKTALKYKYKKYKRIAIIGYSLGGLSVQKAVSELDDNDLQRISHLMLFGVPCNGIPSSDKNTSKESAIEENVSFIKNLKSSWGKRFSKEYPFTFRSVAATDDAYVPVASSLDSFPKENCVVVAGNHFTMMRPENKENDTYVLINQLLIGNNFATKYTDKEAINLALGEYEVLIKELLPKAKDLDRRGLKNLVFALEGVGRGSEAAQILENNEATKEDTDFMGLLAGRNKRMYLQLYEQDLGEKAYSLYKKGYSIASPKEDHKQAFYHAINVAFMALMLYGDESEMQEYARKAIDHTAHVTFDTLWKLATIAEGHLYLGDLKAAKTYYEQASNMANVRQKISIHTNAYKAFTTLLGSENPENEFIIFLKRKFLS